MFRYGYGYGHAGAGFAKLLLMLCLLLLFVLLVTRVFIGADLPVSPQQAGNAVRYLWLGLRLLLAVSAVVAMVLLVIGPWRNRLAGVWLGVVAAGVFFLTEPLYAWAGYFAQYF